MIALDTNLLVYAHRRDSSWHAAASRCVRELAQGAAPWAIPWPCIHEFYSIVTHPRIYTPPSTARQALEQIDAWIASPTLRLLAEHSTNWTTLRAMIEDGRIAGPQVHDARIAALCDGHGVGELWSADRDFSRFGNLRVKNPLLEPDPGQVSERASEYRARGGQPKRDRRR